jgi:hypothetical protein
MEGDRAGGRLFFCVLDGGVIGCGIMLKIPRGVRPGLKFLPPAANPWLLGAARPGTWLYVRLGNRVRRETCLNMERLVDAYRQMQAGKARVIVAFRHPGVEDGTLVLRLMSGIVNREARRLGQRLRRSARGYMLYGRDVPEWAGQFLSWMLPLLGAISVFPGRYHSESIATLRRYLTDQPHPIALAPEGQVTYYNERVAALESGTAQLAFWCMEDLKKQARTEDVLVVPVCTSYHYDPADWKGLLRMLGRLELECGLPPIEGLSSGAPREPLPPGDAARKKIHVRIMRVTGRILDRAEDFYARFYGAAFPPAPGGQSADRLQERIRGVCEAALGLCEAQLHLTPRGDFVQRVLAIRQAGFLRECREDIPDPSALSPLESGMADRVALEAWLCLRHMELVDVLEYVRVDYVQPDSSFDRFVETVTNLWDVVNRLEGGNISGRLNAFRKTARIVVNEPLRVSQRWEQYGRSRRRAVDALTREILDSFKGVAESANDAV